MRTRQASSKAAGNSGGQEQAIGLQPVSSTSAVSREELGTPQVACSGGIWSLTWARASALDAALLTARLNVCNGACGVRLSHQQ